MLPTLIAASQGMWVMHGRLPTLLGLALLIGGCGREPYVLTDHSAMDKLMATKYVAQLQRVNPTRLVCWVEDAGPNYRDLYLGESHQDHTVRVRACRVTSDGRVWVNSDRTLLEHRWVVIE